MNKYIIHCTTAWCGVYEDYSALAESELDLDNISQNLAYALFSEDGWQLVAEENGYDPDTMTEEEALEFWKECNLVYDGSKE